MYETLTSAVAWGWWRVLTNTCHATPAVRTERCRRECASTRKFRVCATRKNRVGGLPDCNFWPQIFVWSQISNQVARRLLTACIECAKHTQVCNPVARRSLDACLGCVMHTPTSRTAEWMHVLGSAARLTFCPHVVHTSNVVPTTWRVLSRRRLGVTVYVSYMGALLVISTLRHTC